MSEIAEQATVKSRLLYSSYSKLAWQLEEYSEVRHSALKLAETEKK
jgi:hypothetical protein